MEPPKVLIAYGLSEYAVFPHAEVGRSEILAIAH